MSGGHIDGAGIAHVSPAAAMVRVSGIRNFLLVVFLIMGHFVQSFRLVNRVFFPSGQNVPNPRIATATIAATETALMAV
jgi:hypothetical protein